MKTSAEIAGYRLYIDDGNYTIAKVTTVPEFGKDGTPNKKGGQEQLMDRRFYGRLDQAVTRMGELVGDDLCHDLDSWLEAFIWVCANIRQQLVGVK